MFKISSMSLKGKIVLAVLANLFVIVGVSGFILYKNYQKDQVFKHLSFVNLPNSEILGEMSLRSQEMDTLLQKLTSAHLSEEEFNATQAEVINTFKEYETADKKYQEVEFVKGEEEIYKPVAEGWNNVKPQIVDSLKIFENAHSPKEISKYSEFIDERVLPLLNYHHDYIQKLVDFQHAQAKATMEHASSLSKETDLFIYASVVAQIVIMLSFGLWVATYFQSILGKIASGLVEETKQVGHSSHELASASQNLSSSASEQAAALQETVSAIDEVNAMVQKNTENSISAEKNSNQSFETAERGKQAVHEMQNAINEISQSNDEIMSQVTKTNDELGEIVKVITEIGNKTKVINDIVFQTKLLSFNASVEAARAGEHGKGFAVVAEEVGNLAQMSGNAAKEIADMLDNSTRKVETMVQDTKSRVDRLIEVSREKISLGTDTSERCGKALEEIVTSVNDVKLLSTEISIASQEQSKGISEISKAMNQLDQVTQQNANASSQTSSLANSLKSQSERMTSIVSDLERTVYGDKSKTPKAQKAVPKKTESAQTKIAAQEPKKENILKFKSKTVKKVKKDIIKEKPVETVAEVKELKPKEKEVKVEPKAEVKSSKYKEVVGGTGIPTQDDPRFEDV